MTDSSSWQRTGVSPEINKTLKTKFFLWTKHLTSGLKQLMAPALEYLSASISPCSTSNGLVKQLRLFTIKACGFGALNTMRGLLEVALQGCLWRPLA